MRKKFWNKLPIHFPQKQGRRNFKKITEGVLIEKLSLLLPSGFPKILLNKKKGFYKKYRKKLKFISENFITYISGRITEAIIKGISTGIRGVIYLFLLDCQKKILNIL